MKNLNGISIYLTKTCVSCNVNNFFLLFTRARAFIVPIEDIFYNHDVHDSHYECDDGKFTMFLNRVPWYNAPFNP